MQPSYRPSSGFTHGAPRRRKAGMAGFGAVNRLSLSLRAARWTPERDEGAAGIGGLLSLLPPSAGGALS